MAESTWNKIKEYFSEQQNVQKRGESLKIFRKMFAMWSHEKFVLKLPKKRVFELIESGIGLPYDPGNGKIMKEWVIISNEYEGKWLKLTKEAKLFAISLAK